MPIASSRFVALLKRPQFWWIVAGVIGTILYALKSHPSLGLLASTDWITNGGILDWFYRSLILKQGNLGSPTFFYPVQGAITTSETPFLQGGLAIALRLAGANAFLAWNLVFGICVIATFLAAYFAFREERACPEAAFVAAAFYASYNAWLVSLDCGIFYRTGFGPPLVWLLLTRMLSDRSVKYPVLLAAAVVVQFLGGMTNALSTLVVLVARSVSDGNLRVQWKRLVLAVVPVGLLGLAYAGWTKRIYPAGEMPQLTGLMAVQLRYYRLDLTNFIPLANWNHGYEDASFPKYQISIARYFVPLLLGVASFGIFILTTVRKVPRVLAEQERRNWELTYGIGAIAILLITHVIVQPRLIIPGFEIRPAYWLVWDIAVLVLAFASYRLAREYEISEKNRSIAMIWVLSVLLSLGPVIFAFGKPFSIGPLAFLDVLVPGITRVRAAARFLLPAGFVLTLAIAGLLDHLISSRKKTRIALSVFIGGALLSPVNRLWPDPRIKSIDITVDPAACPACSPGDMRPVPLPNQWIIANGSGPLLELPAGLIKGDPREVSHDMTYQFYWMLDGIPRLNGFASWLPPSYNELLRTVESFPDPASLTAIKSRGAKWLLVHGDRYPPDEWERIQAALDPPPPGLTLEKKWGTVWLYRIE